MDRAGAGCRRGGAALVGRAGAYGHGNGCGRGDGVDAGRDQSLRLRGGGGHTVRGGAAVRRRGAAAGGHCRDSGKNHAPYAAGADRSGLVAVPLQRYHWVCVQPGYAHQLPHRLRRRQRLLPAPRPVWQLQRVRHHFSGCPRQPGLHLPEQYAVRTPHGGRYHVRLHLRVQAAVVLRCPPVFLPVHQRGDIPGGSVRGADRPRRA